MDTKEKKPLAHEDARKRYERRAPTTGTFQHFATPEQEAEHLCQVAEAQANNEVPF
jgi:hypothetical protein